MNLTIDLDSLQKDAAPSFNLWDEAVSKGDTDVARNARDKITDLAKQTRKRTRKQLLDQYGISDGGLYLFARKAKEPPEPHLLTYFGLVWNQRLDTRMYDYLGKELSVLDSTLLKLDEEEARVKIINRLLIAMPGTDPETIRKRYIMTHMQSRLKSRADTIFLYPVQSTRPALEDAEYVLIQAGISCGQKLANRQKRNPMKRQPVAESKKLALGALVKWKEEGVDRRICTEMTSKIEDIDFSD